MCLYLGTISHYSNQKETELIYIVQFQKISIPTPRKINRNSKGEGVLKDQFFQGKYEAKIEFPVGMVGGGGGSS